MKIILPLRCRLFESASLRVSVIILLNNSVEMTKSGQVAWSKKDKAGQMLASEDVKMLW